MKHNGEDRAVEFGRERVQAAGASEPIICATAQAIEQIMAEREIARLSPDRRDLACRLIRRIAQIETEAGPDVAEAVIEGLIDILRNRVRVLS